MKKIERLLEYVPLESSIIVNKTGLKRVNNNPGQYELRDSKLCELNTAAKISIVSLSNIKIGDEVLLGNGKYGIIDKMEIKRLADISPEEATKSGIKQAKNDLWIHYSPKLYFPQEVLKDQEDGYPYFKSAIGSFFSLFTKKYGAMDIYANPWVWVYTFRFKIK